jgi:altronate dehydratase small subunit
MDAIMLSVRDNVATALRDLGKDDVAAVGVRDETRRIPIREPIPFGHKFAVSPLRAGDLVLKYGEVMGRATRDIPVGAHAHVHNIESLRGRGDLATTGGVTWSFSDIGARTAASARATTWACSRRWCAPTT